MNLGFDPTQNGQVPLSSITIDGCCVLSGNLFVKLNNSGTNNVINLSTSPPAVGTISLSQSVYPINVRIDQVL